MSGEVVCLYSADALEEFRSLACAAALSSVLEVSSAEILVGQEQPTVDVCRALNRQLVDTFRVLYGECRARALD